MSIELNGKLRQSLLSGMVVTWLSVLWVSDLLVQGSALRPCRQMLGTSRQICVYLPICSTDLLGSALLQYKILSILCGTIQEKKKELVTSEYFPLQGGIQLGTERDICT